MRLRLGFFARVVAHDFLLLALIAVSVVLIGRFLIGPKMRERFEQEDAWIIRHAVTQLADRDRLQAELHAFRDELQIDISVYDEDDRLVATSIMPPLSPHAALAAAAPDARRGVELAPGTVLLALRQGPVKRGHAVLRHPPPDLPLERWIVLVLGAIGLAAIVAVPLARSVVQPIAELARATRAFGQGAVQTRVRSPRVDEFGDLARVFDEMADRVEGLLRTEKQLLANVSHELRTPLARIHVVLEMASEGEPTHVHRHLGEIAHDLAELDRLVDDVLTTARLDLAEGRVGTAEVPMHWSVVDPTELLGRSCDRFRELYAERPLQVTIETPVPAVRCDPMLLRRVVDNLLDNAARYAPAGEAVELRAWQQGADLMVTVTDHGIGIQASDLPRVFEPFYRAERSRDRRTGGVGLGLALVRRIVEAHRGRVALASEPGRGTCATVYIPAATE